MKKLGTKPEATQSKWQKDCKTEELGWGKIYSKPFECSNSSELRNFQFTLLHMEESQQIYFYKSQVLKILISVRFAIA